MSYPSRQPSYQTLAPPAGWGPIPFQGAAPPIPAGYAINQQQWSMGQWLPNPNYNPARYPAPVVPWMPSQSWQQFHHAQSHAAAAAAAVQQQANFNPYKKVIKPPSEEYLSQPLSDNPLGLSDLVEAENRYQDQSNEPQTPWLWNPYTLSNECEGLSKRNKSSSASPPSSSSSNPPTRHSTEPSIPATKPPTPAPLARHATEPVIPSSSRPPPASRESFTAELELRPTFSPKIVRTPDHYRNANTGASLSRSNSSASTSAPPPSQQPPIESLADRMRRASIESTTSSTPPLSRSNSAATDSRSSSYDNTAAASRIYAAPDARNSSSSISGVPTFSDEPGVMAVGSPPPLPLPPPRSRSRGSYDQYQAQGLGSATTLHTIVEDVPAAARRRAHSPHPPVDPAAYYTQAHTHTPPDAQTRSSPGQQHTPPESYPTPRRAHHQHSHSSHTPPDHSPSSSGSGSSSGSRSGARYYPPPPTENQHPLPVPPRPSNFDVEREREKDDFRFGSGSGSRSRNGSVSGEGGHGKPLPHPPPVSTSLLPSPTSPTGEPPSPPSAHAISPTATTASTSHPTQLGGRLPKVTYVPMPLPPSLPKRTRSVRQGFWNRRGDHLTADGFVVYAPPDLAYPDDLREYPEAGVGYKDDWGRVAEYDEEREELADSLPRRGEGPKRPYREFVVFVGREYVVR